MNRLALTLLVVLLVITSNAQAGQDLVSTTFTWKYEDAPQMVGGNNDRTWYFKLTPGSGDWTGIGLMSANYFTGEFADPYFNFHDANFRSHFSTLTVPGGFPVFATDVNGSIRADIATSSLHLPYAEWMNSPYSKSAAGSRQLEEFDLRNIEVRFWKEGVNPALSLTFVGYGTYAIPEPSTSGLLAAGLVLWPRRRWQWRAFT